MLNYIYDACIEINTQKKSTVTLVKNFKRTN